MSVDRATTLIFLDRIVQVLFIEDGPHSGLSNLLMKLDLVHCMQCNGCKHLQRKIKCCEVSGIPSLSEREMAIDMV